MARDLNAAVPRTGLLQLLRDPEMGRRTEREAGDASRADPRRRRLLGFYLWDS
jgi:hypothetical protein